MDKTQLRKLIELIEEGYNTPAELANVLDLGVEMFFYVEEEAFTQREIQQVVSAIRGIIVVLRG
ncbi:hypothetical protein FVB32_01490 [Flagellimonas hymeniacidonis]|uniref:Uncharacterized protein n=1 Tax=Flagellimonas hymeniacidonis TaxID=2603628 RepID=A0A5C8V8B8_9FLAO|nr:hypothetical protein [Flagellimonas hymeniacidonis]TXN36988.1 hypothetical protein FVB32_01490 [Flagellimonas hymeniacidonis]